MRCASCLTDNPDGNLFCGHCGASLRLLGHGAGRTGGATRATAPLPPKWGELKIATIFFADIVSSTTHIAGLDAEQAMEQLQPAVQRMCEAVEVLGGTVVRTMGDGILALFGVPHTVEGHARLACEAALKLQKAFSGNQLGLQLRVGLHSGQVASDPQAFDSNIGGGVHGSAIHLASRVVGVAEPGGICLSADCLALTGGACEVRAMGLHTLKGIAEPTEIYALVRVKSDAPDHHFHQAVLSPFQGRAGELATLQNALQRTEQGQCAVIGLSGAAGTGKSRLCFEFVQWCRARLVPVTEVRTQLYGYATPLAPVLSLLRGWFFHITNADDAAAARGRIQARLSRLGVSGSDDLALFNEFLGVADPAGVPCALAPKARRARLLALFGDMVRYTGATTSVIVCEDLHWLDEASADFLDVLVQSVPGTRTLLLFNYRLTYKAHWSALPHFQEIHLAELGAADTEALVRELAGPHPQWQDAFALIVQRSAGNPFFAEGLVRLLLEGGVLSGSPGKRDLGSRVRALPATVQAVIGARIDRLGATQKGLLHICAVIGKEIPLPVLQRVARYLAGRIERELDGLCEAELLELLREIVGDRYFGFHHPLIQEVAYNTQLKARRASLHAAVATAMEAYYSAQPDEFAALMAFHFEAAGLFLDAARHAARAARWVAATNSAQGIKHWRKVRELLKDQPRNPQVASLLALAGGRIVYLGWREGLSLQEVKLIIDESIELANEADPRLIQLLLFAHGRMLQSSGGSADGYVESVQKALSLDSQGADVGRTAMLNVALSHAYAWSGLLEQALAASDLALPELDRIDTFDREFLGFSVEQWALSIRMRLLNRMGRFEEAQACLKEMPVEASSTDDPVMRQIAHYVYVDLAWCMNDAALAKKHSAHVVSIAGENGGPYSQVFALSCSGLSELVSMEFNKARRTFASALKLIRNIKVAVEFEAEVLVGLAESCYALDKFDESLSYAEEAVTTSRRQCNRVSECRALIVLGAALARRDEFEQANTALAHAEQLIAMTGAKVFHEALRRARDRCPPSTG